MAFAAINLVNNPGTSTFTFYEIDTLKVYVFASCLGNPGEIFGGGEVSISTLAGMPLNQIYFFRIAYTSNVGSVPPTFSWILIND